MEKTGGVEMSKQNDVVRQVEYDANVRDEWLFTKWDAKPTFAADEFKFTPNGGPMREDKYSDPPQLLSGAAAPNFTLPDMSGKVVRLSDLRGKIVVLDFWNTSCGYCIADMPAIRAVIAKYPAKDVDLLTICNDDAATTGQLLKEKGWQSLPVALDADGNVGKDYKVSGYPTLLVVGRDGVVAAVEDGAPKSFGPDLRDMLDQAVAAKSATESEGGKGQRQKPGPGMGPAPARRKSEPSGGIVTCPRHVPLLPSVLSGVRSPDELVIIRVAANPDPLDAPATSIPNAVMPPDTGRPQLLDTFEL